jgi:pulcherriminic acid synthase
MSADAAPLWRSYEIYQRIRPREIPSLVVPRRLSSREYLDDPFPVLAEVREGTPCFRDWHANAFWVTRYDDVTSVFVDDANYETRPRRWSLGWEGAGADLGGELAVQQAVTTITDRVVEATARRLVGELRAAAGVDLASEVCARLPVDVLRQVVGVPDEQADDFARQYLTMHFGVGIDPVAAERGRTAADALVAMVSPLVDPGREADDLAATVAALGGSAHDLVVTLLEGDHQTAHGALASLWSLLLTHPDQLALVRDDRRLMKFAYLETLRHSPPVLSADRYARHEVERFGRLLPDGALVRCSAAAANRDPRIFEAPDEFRVDRTDVCQREPRGQYRADGLAAGASFGTGAPSKHPAEPEDRPRSRYALARDTVVTTALVVLDELPGLRLAPGASPTRRALRLGGTFTCWELPVSWSA